MERDVPDQGRGRVRHEHRGPEPCQADARPGVVGVGHVGSTTRSDGDNSAPTNRGVVAPARVGGDHVFTRR